MRIFFIFLIIIGGGAYLWFNWTEKQNDKFWILEVENATINAELARTRQEKEKGLSGKEGLKPDEGMLFIYDKEGAYSFWMKDMKFPIDIIWFNESWKVVHIEENLEPATYPDTFQSSSPARYILEVNAGFIDRHYIDVGDIAVISH